MHDLIDFVRLITNNNREATDVVVEIFSNMETDSENDIGAPVGEGTPQAAIIQSEMALDIIRTETVLSKLPVHNLAKKGKVEIRIVKTDPQSGKIELLWDVAPNPKFGDPRALAYKLDTIVINSKLTSREGLSPK